MNDNAASRGTVYLVDGTSQLFRAHFAIRGLTNADGLPTNAVFGFTSMLRKLIVDERPRYIAVAWDRPGKVFRHDLDPEYKANRPEMPEDLRVQFPYAKQVCEVFKIPGLELDRYEADDLIATVAKQAHDEGFDVVIVASDKDLLQLVRPGIKVHNPTNDGLLDEAGVEEAFGVRPEYVLDVQALMGDSVDNIPGVAGVGAKTAKAIVGLYGHLEDVIEYAEAFAAFIVARDAWLDAWTGTEKAAALEPDALDTMTDATDGVETALASLRALERSDEYGTRLADA
ncbi:MAG: hypothetical protein OER88_07300, partial [Planctomycetota bacterium]|nr:hypothetical protein [Planctomycetota bacterium]